mmetsp:Transcript_17176/g.19150  ORF Transcript_17176/g.19150 Transcript_17176/m.19150 type:complete len:248 (+) Transcript_17176:192-935(+)
MINIQADIFTGKNRKRNRLTDRTHAIRKPHEWEQMWADEELAKEYKQQNKKVKRERKNDVDFLLDLHKKLESERAEIANVFTEHLTENTIAYLLSLETTFKDLLNKQDGEFEVFKPREIIHCQAVYLAASLYKLKYTTSKNRALYSRRMKNNDTVTVFKTATSRTPNVSLRQLTQCFSPRRQRVKQKILFTGTDFKCVSPCIPSEILLKIFVHLDLMYHVLEASMVCKRWYLASTDKYMLLRIAGLC